MLPITFPSFYYTTGVFAGQTVTEAVRQMAKCCLDGGSQGGKACWWSELLSVGDTWQALPCTMWNTVLFNTPCCVLEIITGSCSSQVAWNCCPCNNHCHGWLQNILSYFGPGECKKKKSCKNKSSKSQVFFSYATVRLLLQELPCQDLIRGKRSHSYVEGDLPEVP